MTEATTDEFVRHLQAELVDAEQIQDKRLREQRIWRLEAALQEALEFQAHVLSQRGVPALLREGLFRLLAHGRCVFVSRAGHKAAPALAEALARCVVVLAFRGLLPPLGGRRPALRPYAEELLAGDTTQLLRMPGVPRVVVRVDHTTIDHGEADRGLLVEAPRR